MSRIRNNLSWWRGEAYLEHPQKSNALEELAKQAKTGANDKVYCYYCFDEHKRTIQTANERARESGTPPVYVFVGELDDYRQSSSFSRPYHY